MELEPSVFQYHTEAAELNFTPPLDIQAIFARPYLCTGVHINVRSGFCQYEEERLRSPACSRQQNAIFPPHFHGTWSAPLYLVGGCDRSPPVRIKKKTQVNLGFFPTSCNFSDAYGIRVPKVHLFPLSMRNAWTRSSQKSRCGVTSQ